jgi:hypothetical protein
LKSLAEPKNAFVIVREILIQQLKNIILLFITINNPDSDTRQGIEDWRTDYNTKRPVMAFGGLAPKAFADQIDRAQKIA